MKNDSELHENNRVFEVLGHIDINPRYFRTPEGAVAQANNLFSEKLWFKIMMLGQKRLDFQLSVGTGKK